MTTHHDTHNQETTMSNDYDFGFGVRSHRKDNGFDAFTIYAPSLREKPVEETVTLTGVEALRVVGWLADHLQVRGYGEELSAIKLLASTIADDHAVDEEEI